MKTKLTFLSLLCTIFLFAQDRIFQKPISEKNLKESQKVSRELLSTYSATSYYSQSPFNLKADLQISLPTGKEITAKFSKTFSYSNKSESYVYTIENDPKAELVFSTFDRFVTGMYASGTGEKIMFHQTDANTFAVSVVSDSRIINQDSIDDYILEKTEFKQQSKFQCMLIINTGLPGNQD